jgi:hypothetical protein
MNRWLVIAIVAGTMPVACWLAILGRAAVRTRAIPRCWSCGASKVRASYSHRLGDTFASLLLFCPMRCAGCRIRFFGVRFLAKRGQFKHGRRQVRAT